MKIRSQKSCWGFEGINGAMLSLTRLSGAGMVISAGSLTLHNYNHAHKALNRWIKKTATSTANLT